MAQFGIIGHKGRMGQALLKAVAEAGHEVSGGVDEGEQPGPLATRCEVLVDFSAPGALSANLAAARVAGTPIVIGTTGLNDEHHRMIDDSAAYLPILQTGNTSLGVTLLAHLVRDACLGAFDLAAVLTNDTDLLEPVRIVRDELNLPVTLLTPVSRPAASLTQAASEVRHIKPYLGPCQLPDPIEVLGKPAIVKPAGW